MMVVSCMQRAELSCGDVIDGMHSVGSTRCSSVCLKEACITLFCIERSVVPKSQSSIATGGR